jgi:hypothetical protein
MLQAARHHWRSQKLVGCCSLFCLGAWRLGKISTGLTSVQHLHHIDGDNFYWLAILRACGVLSVVSMLHVYASFDVDIILAKARSHVSFTHDLVPVNAALRNTNRAHIDLQRCALEYAESCKGTWLSSKLNVIGLQDDVEITSYDTKDE